MSPHPSLSRLLGLFVAATLLACSVPSPQSPPELAAPPVSSPPSPEQRMADTPVPERMALAGQSAAKAEVSDVRPAPPPALHAPLVAHAQTHAYAPPWDALPPPPREPDTAKYTAVSDSPWQRVAEHPVSTFSASVDTGSYANVCRFINRGQLPPRDAVRVEELVNLKTAVASRRTPFLPTLART